MFIFLVLVFFWKEMFGVEEEMVLVFGGVDGLLFNLGLGVLGMGVVILIVGMSGVFWYIVEEFFLYL